MGLLAKVVGFNRPNRPYRRARVLLILIVLAYLTDIVLHLFSFRVVAPPSPLDLPFATGCGQHDQTPHPDAFSHDHMDEEDASFHAKHRENATIMVLARNSDLKGVLASIQSLEDRWNKWYHYPITLLNDAEWDPNFQKAVQSVTESSLTFAQIPAEMWSWPRKADGTDMVDKKQAASSWKQMEAAGLPYVTQESYHHMCRFFSGYFFDHSAIAKYRYYWRVEPDVEFTCDITYDPFRHMKRSQKIYGYTMALWEIGSTCPSLFRTTDDFRNDQGISTTSLWRSMVSASWAPLPIRWLVMSLPSLFHSRDRYGDAWNHCHFWSNFEIADMEFFRSEQYRSYFAALDKAGGFFTERWGDAPVHSFGLSLFARPEQLHYFEDIGYRHPPFQHCPPKGMGCNCTCDPEIGAVSNYCLKRLRKGVLA